MELFAAIQIAEIVSTIVFSILGFVILGFCWWLITKLAPFPIIKEIETDQNTSLAILIGSVFVALSIIIAAVILS